MTLQDLTPEELQKFERTIHLFGFIKGDNIYHRDSFLMNKFFKFEKIEYQANDILIYTKAGILVIGVKFTNWI